MVADMMEMCGKYGSQICIVCREIKFQIAFLCRMSISIIIIAFTVGVSIWAWREPGVFEKNAFYPFKTWHNKEWFRIITSSFLHVDYQHLFFNMLTLFFFGSVVESYLGAYTGSGTLYFILLYITGMLVSEIGTLFKFKDDRSYSSVGASGAVSAVIFSGIWFNPTSQILVMFIPMPGFVFGAIYLIYTAYSAKNDFSGRINHDAHFYGSIWGVLFSIFVAPSSISNFFEALINFKIF